MKRIQIGEHEHDLTDPDFVPNLVAVASLIKVQGKPELSDIVVDLWSKATAMRLHILNTDKSLVEQRMIKMAKVLTPLLGEVLPELGKTNVTCVSDYADAHRALIKLLGDYHEQN